MKYLGIDYGLAKTGVAVSFGKLAEPHCVIRGNDKEELISKILKIIDKEDVSEIVVGVSENKMGERQEKFSEELAMASGLKVNMVDETLSTHEAQQKSIEVGKGRKKRKQMEDAYAAAIILQRFLDDS